MYLHIVRCVEGELQSHIGEGLRDDDTTIEVDTPICPTGTSYRCSDSFCGGDMESWVHDITNELDIAAILNGERLQWDGLQRVFHLTVIQRVLTCQLPLFRRSITQTERSPTHQIDIVRLGRIQIRHDMGTLGDIEGEVHFKT